MRAWGDQSIAELTGTRQWPLAACRGRRKASVLGTAARCAAALSFVDSWRRMCGPKEVALVNIIGWQIFCEKGLLPSHVALVAPLAARFGLRGSRLDADQVCSRSSAAAALARTLANFGTGQRT